MLESIRRGLVDARKVQGLSRRELAKLAGTSHQTVRAFEEGKGKRLDILAMMAVRLGLSLDLREHESGAG